VLVVYYLVTRGPDTAVLVQLRDCFQPLLGFLLDGLDGVGTMPAILAM